MFKEHSTFSSKFTKETTGTRAYAFQPTDEDQLQVGQYIKFNHGIDSNHMTRMIGKIVEIGYSEQNRCKYFETITECGFYTTTADKIYKVYKAKLKGKIVANRLATCIALNTNHSEELSYMISTLDKMKNYILQKNLGKIEACNIVDTNRSYSYNMTVSYPNGNIVTYSIPDRNAHNISFQLKTNKKVHTFKVRNRKGQIELNFEKVKRMIKRFL